jgi:hypothetical protein
MRFFSDILVFFGAILLTFGTDLEVQTAGQSLSSVGGLLGVLASLIGAGLLTTGILNHRRLSRERESTDDQGAADVDSGQRGGKRDDRR